MSKQKQENSDIVSGCFGVIFAAIFFGGALFGGALTGMLWPWTTEGCIRRVDYSFSRANVIFDDGRTMSLRGNPTRSLMPGKYYKITYNGAGYFYDVEEIEK